MIEVKFTEEEYNLLKLLLGYAADSDELQDIDDDTFQSIYEKFHGTVE